MDIILVLKQMIILSILMIVGYLANKKKIMTTESDKFRKQKQRFINI
ncbi:hypothetical protein [Clostridium beijerinckii]|uniref:Uncharacterized protein n=1 Tax=Clostridium beijerinckii TaxID=1520 RepID=A0A1S8RQX7_CLOBE|nr:hypothetical protein [Clostridium beijerinckii]NRY63257.1 putative permease [Clostridium beijerinckii]OOM55604.1 hypothetical protein CLBCK_44860 [Clostridium beijerinckii]